MFNKTESGRSMIEMLGVLAIIGILSAGGIAGYTMAMKNYRANKALETLQLASTQIITAFAGNDDYSNLTTENATKLKIDISSPYGTDLTVAGNEGSFSLTMANVPGQACIKIAQAPWGDQYSVGDSSDSTKFTTNPFDCSDDTNTIVFTYNAGGTGTTSCTGGTLTACITACRNSISSCLNAAATSDDPLTATEACRTTQLSCEANCTASCPEES